MPDCQRELPHCSHNLLADVQSKACGAGPSGRKSKWSRSSAGAAGPHSAWQSSIDEMSKCPSSKLFPFLRVRCSCHPYWPRAGQAGTAKPCTDSRMTCMLSDQALLIQHVCTQALLAEAVEGGAAEAGVTPPASETPSADLSTSQVASKPTVRPSCSCHRGAALVCPAHVSLQCCRVHQWHGAEAAAALHQHNR